MIAARRAVQTQHFQTNIDLDCWSKLQTSGAKSNPASGKKLAAFTTRDKGKGCRQPAAGRVGGGIFQQEEMANSPQMFPT